MKIAFFSTRDYDRIFFDRFIDASRYRIDYFAFQLNERSASVMDGHEAVCAFINDRIDRACLEQMRLRGVRLLALRSAGFNHVDLAAAREQGIVVARVPAYSPASVAEHTVGLILALNRKLHKAFNRVREGNFSIDGLMGFDLEGKTVGIVGTGKIGTHFARIMHGFGCRLIAYDPHPSTECEALGVSYVTLEEIYEQSSILSLQCPLTPETHHMLDERAFARMQDGITLINTSRGKLIDTRALIRALKRGRIRCLGLDVYEEEENIFFEDWSDRILQDDVLARLLTFPNVLITSHQAFLTEDALSNIARTTLGNIAAFAEGRDVVNRVEA